MRNKAFVSVYNEFRVKHLPFLKKRHNNITVVIINLIIDGLACFSDNELIPFTESVEGKKKFYHRIRDYIFLNLGLKKKKYESSVVKYSSSAILNLYKYFVFSRVRYYFKRYNCHNVLLLRDKVTDILVKIWTVADKYNPSKGNFSSWLNIIIKNDIINDLRKSNHFLFIGDDPKYSDSFDDPLDRFLFANHEYLYNGDDDFNTDPIFDIPNMELIISTILKCDFIFPWKTVTFFLDNMMDIKPKQVVTEYSEVKLTDLSTVIKEKFLDSSHLNPEFIINSFIPFENRMKNPINDIIPIYDDNSRSIINCSLETAVANTKLSNYYGERKAVTISNWNNATIKRVKKHFINHFGDEFSL